MNKIKCFLGLHFWSLCEHILGLDTGINFCVYRCMECYKIKLEEVEIYDAD